MLPKNIEKELFDTWTWSWCLHREVVTRNKSQPPLRKGQVSSSEHNQGPRGGRLDVLCCSKSWSFTSSAASSAVASSPHRPPTVPRPQWDTICSLKDKRWWAWQIVYKSYRYNPWPLRFQLREFQTLHVIINKSSPTLTSSNTSLFPVLYWL